jgi:hypothetical protein
MTKPFSTLLLAVLGLFVIFSGCKRKKDEVPEATAPLCNMLTFYEDGYSYNYHTVLDSLDRLKQIDAFDQSGQLLGTLAHYFYNSDNKIVKITRNSIDGLIEYEWQYNAAGKPSIMVRRRTINTDLYYDSLLYNYSIPNKIDIVDYGDHPSGKDTMHYILETDAAGNVLREYSSWFKSMYSNSHPANRDTMILETEYEYYSDQEITVPYLYFLGFGEWGTTSAVEDENFFANNLLKTIHSYSANYNETTGVVTTKNFEKVSNIKYEKDQIGNVTKMTYTFNNYPPYYDGDYSVYYTYDCP